MRQIERIPIYVDKFTPEIIGNILVNWFQWKDDDTVFKIYNERDLIKEYWLKNQDLRLSQVLINMGYIPNTPGFWYYTEDNNVMISAGCDPREVLFWGQNYDKDMNRLPKTNWILIKDMATDHIRAVISYAGEKLSERYKKVFIAEFIYRGVKDYNA